MLLWGVLWIWYYVGSLEYDLVLLNQTSNISMFIVLSVLVGAMGKSAQILFHVWLADAMEGLNYIKRFLVMLSGWVMSVWSKIIFDLILCFIWVLYWEWACYPWLNFCQDFVVWVIMDSRDFSYQTLDFSNNLVLFATFTGRKNGTQVATPLEVIAGLLLSDGYLRNLNSNKCSTGNYRLEFPFKSPVYDYITWLKFDVLGSLCTDSLPTLYPKINPNQYWFVSRSMSLFTEWNEFW